MKHRKLSVPVGTGRKIDNVRLSFTGTIRPHRDGTLRIYVDVALQ